jgi:beta-barrel assembly-enhancing protease
LYKPFFLSASVAFLIAFAPPAAAQGDRTAESLIGLRALDARVATIGHRLAVSSLDLCTDRQMLPGLAIHDLSQYGGDYRDAAIRAFRLDRGPAVLALAAGGPAERGGLRLDDILLSVDGTELPRGTAAAARTFDRVEAMLGTIEAAFADGEAELAVLRGAEHLSLRIAAERGCATRFQLIPSRRLNALADGRYVQVTTAIGEYVQDDHELAAVLAHEFAHNILGHRARLDAAGVARGFFGNFGRNARLIRATEAEADRLSIYLLDRAGYDPAAAVRFWSRFGRRGLNFFGSPTHPNWRQRIALFEAEIAALRRAKAAGEEVPAPDFLPGPSRPSG